MNLDRVFRIPPFIALYSFTHLAVDAACAFLLLGVLELNGHIVLSLILYNASAFVLQAPIGFIIDKTLNPKLAALTGLVFVAVSYLFWSNIFAALVIAGVGNALFHVGGGSMVLSLKSKKATCSGIFVAPGGIGLALGTYLAASHLHLMLFPLAILILGFALCFIKTPVFNRINEREHFAGYGVLLLSMIMVPIIVRSMVGLSVAFPWKEHPPLLLLLVVAIALGKALGGILADKYGLKKVGVGGLIASAPFLAFFPSLPVLGIVGIILFNFTMPVTLIALFNTIPKYKGLSFGLASTALFIGSLPILMGKELSLMNDWILFSLIILASMILFAGLRFKNKSLETV